MNFETICLKCIKDSANLTGQQNIDADIILPDYYDSIGKIIRCEIIPTTEAITTNGDKISVSGSGKYTIVYIGEDKQMYSYENECKYTKVFQSKYAEGCISPIAEQTVFSLNFRAIGPKRIELRSVIQLRILIKNSEEKNLISKADEEGFVVKTENLDYLSEINIVSSSFSVTSNHNSDSFKEAVDIIIRKTSKINVAEIKTIHNKAFIKGTAETQMTYFCKETGNVLTTILNTPISEIIDIYGAEENDICNVYFDDVFTDIILKDDHKNGKSAEIRISVNLHTEISRSFNADLITDIYSTKTELLTEKAAVEFITSADKSAKSEAVSFESDLYDENTYTVAGSWIDSIRISPEKKEGRFSLLISATFNAVLKDESALFTIISREHTFESEIMCPERDAETRNLRADVLSSGALLLPDGRIRFTSDIHIEADILSIRKVNAFTEITEDESLSEKKNSRYIIYFAKKDEEIWTIAKENRTSVDVIRSVNSLNSDKLSEDKVLMLPSF